MYLAKRQRRHTICKLSFSIGEIGLAKYAIVNADDLGLSKRVNEYIMRAHVHGVVTSASLMANMPGFDDAVVLTRLTPALGVGLHFNLTVGKPVSPAATVPSLAGAGGYFTGKRLDWREEDIERELAHQYDKLVAKGLKPTHMDSHHHIHIEVPSVYSVMKRWASRCQIPIRLHPWTTDHSDRSSHFDAPFSTNRLIMDTYDGNGGFARLLNHIESLSEGTTEIMCHPGSSGDILASLSESIRGTELWTLTHPQIMEAIQRCGVQLIHFGQIHLVSPAPVTFDTDKDAGLSPIVPPVQEKASMQARFEPSDPTIMEPLKSKRRRASNQKRLRKKRASGKKKGSLVRSRPRRRRRRKSAARR